MVEEIAAMTKYLHKMRQPSQVDFRRGSSLLLKVAGCFSDRLLYLAHCALEFLDASLQCGDGHARKRKFLHFAGRVRARFQFVDV